MPSLDVHACRIDELDVEPGSVDLILTDPPYPREHLPLWGALGEFAASALREGGALVAMSGQIYLDSILAALSSSDLTYRWTIACMTPGANGRVWHRHIYAGWKPILWYSKGDQPTATPARWIEDRIVSKPDKRFHNWGQDLFVFQHLALSFSRYGDLICDPFLGGGTTAVAAATLGRRFVGCDPDETAIRSTLARVEAAREYVRLHGLVVPEEPEQEPEPAATTGGNDGT